MKIQITVKQQNLGFDKAYADEYHFGKSNPGNERDSWSDSYEITRSIDKVRIFKNTEHEIQVKPGVTIKLSNVNVLTAYFQDEVVGRFVISKSIIQRMLKPPRRKNSETERYYFYLKPDSEIEKLSNNIYLNKEDIPSSLFK